MRGKVLMANHDETMAGIAAARPAAEAELQQLLAQRRNLDVQIEAAERHLAGLEDRIRARVVLTIRSPRS